MRDNIRAFVQIAADAFALRGPVYEFGSLQVEPDQGGNDLRSCFEGQEFVGCDLRQGPGVDRVEDLASLQIPPESAQTIVCVDTLEHVFEARKAVDEMIRVLAPGGIILLAAPMDFRVHNYPTDYWRMTPSCIDRLLAPLDATLLGSQGVESFPHTVFGIGAKGPISPTFARGANQFISLYQHYLDTAANTAPWTKKFKAKLLGWVRSKGERRRLRHFYQSRFVLQLPTLDHWCAEALLPEEASTSTGARIDLS